jgi:hypothetical protein
VIRISTGSAAGWAIGRDPANLFLACVRCNTLGNYESQLAGSLLSANKVSIRGSGGRACPSPPKSRYYLGGRVGFGSVFPGHVPCGKRVTVGYRFPLGPHFGEPFGVLGRGADVCEKGEGVLAQIGKVRVKAPFATAVDVGGGRTKVARLEGLCRAL